MINAVLEGYPKSKKELYVSIVLADISSVMYVCVCAWLTVGRSWNRDR